MTDAAKSRPYRWAAFISYCHVDNEAGWIAEFHRRLQSSLRQDYDAKLDVWFDPQIPPGAAVNRALASELANTAVLVPVVSPGWLDSDYCIWELETFVETARRLADGAPGKMTRIVPVVKHPRRQDQTLPETIGQILWVEFFEGDPQKGPVKKVNPDADLNGRFWELVGRVSWGVQQALKECAGRIERTGRTVFLSWTASDLFDVREVLRERLERAGHRVVPASPTPPDDRDVFERTVTEAMEVADVCVLLVSEKLRRLPEDQLEIGQRQVELAGRSAREPVIWMKPGAALRPLGREPMKTSVEELEQEILRRVRGGEPPRTTTARTDGLQRLYLAHHPDDRLDPRLRQLRLALQRRVKVSVPVFQGSLADPSFERQCLEQSDGVLIYWGRGDEAWFYRQEPILNAPNVRARAVFVAPNGDESEASQAEKEMWSRPDTVLLREPGQAAMLVGDATEAAT